MRRDAAVARAEDRVPAVEPVHRRAPAARFALVARRRGVAEIAATHSLAEVAAHRGHVPKLGRCSQQQRLRDHGEMPDHALRLRDIAHPRQGADPQASTRQVFDGVERQCIDVDEQARTQYVLPHQVYFGGATSEKRAVDVGARRCDGVVDVGDPRIAERPHPYAPPDESRTSRIAARMFGYAAHLQMLPLIHSAISASSAA